jgi:hypothetical protein
MYTYMARGEEEEMGYGYLRRVIIIVYKAITHLLINIKIGIIIIICDMLD